MTIKSNIMDMVMGDSIPCRYIAQSPNNMGYFTELGTCTAPLITYPLATTANGRFNFIMAGYDFLGRKKLVPDRSLQVYHSWDSMNENGLIDGIPIDFKEKVTVKSASASTEWGAGYAASKAIDGVISTYDAGMFITSSSATGEQWLQLDLESPQLIDEIRLYWYENYKPTYPVRIQILDNGTWTEIISRPANMSKGVNVNELIMPITLSKPIQSYRVVSTGVFSIVEAQFFRNIPSVLKYEMRIMTGGNPSNPSDENEWDKIISQSSLNGSITPADDNIWHWYNHYTLTAETDLVGYQSYRNSRGYGTVSTNTRTGSASKDNYISFRPILLVQAPSNKFLIKDNDQIKATDGKIMNYSNLLPFNKDMFNQNGMDNLQNMNNSIISMIANSKYNIALYKLK